MQFNYNFTGHKKIFFGISITLILIGMIFMFVNGLNADIEFKGGAVMDIQTDKKLNTAKLEKIVKDITKENPQVQLETKNGVNKGAVVKIPKELNPETAKSTKEKITAKVKSEFKAKTVSMSVDNTSATVGKEERMNAFLEVVVACILMLIYITFRFEFKTGVAAIIALLHDVLIMVGVYAVFNVPVNGAFIAAILTIIGYSINDTIIVFDRIRENISKNTREDLETVTNNSINETLLRSVNTVLTVLIALSVLYFMGVRSIKEFTFPLIVGVTSGAYSSIFIASPIWLIWRQSEDKKAVIK
jgi:preprotein translocase subunit SecF